ACRDGHGTRVARPGVEHRADLGLRLRRSHAEDAVHVVFLRADAGRALRLRPATAGAGATTDGPVPGASVVSRRRAGCGPRRHLDAIRPHHGKRIREVAVHPARQRAGVSRLHPLHPRPPLGVEMSPRTILFDAVHLSILLLLPPLLLGVINKTKAAFAGRVGPPFLQPYYDLIKLWQKGSVFSTTTSWVFKAGPVVGLATAVLAGLLLPVAGHAPFSFEGDAILFAYLFALGRFFTIAA